MVIFSYMFIYILIKNFEGIIMSSFDNEKTITVLNDILEYELAGVVKYTHFALMVTGPNRLTLDKFFKSQATESLQHAQQAGELLTGLGGHPSQSIPKINETNQHSVKNLLTESLHHEEKAIFLYNQLLEYSAKKVYILKSMQEK